MKVALVASTYLPRSGGLERHVDRLARGLVARGARVEVLTQRSSRQLPGFSETGGVVVRRFAAPIGTGAVSPALCEYLRRTAASFDLVHVHAAHAPLALAVARTRPRRLVFTPHAPIERMLRWPYTRVTGAVLHHAVRTAATSTVEGDLLRRRCPWAAARVRVVPTGVDLAAIMAAQTLNGDGSSVLSVGRLERHKRVDRTIAAMAGVPPEFRLTVIGAGPARHRLEARAWDLRVSSRVHFTGAVSDEVLYRWLRSTRVLVCVAEQEASGLSVMEALSAGAAVVASDIPIHREAASWVPGAPVVFVPTEGSPLRIADAICEASRMQAAASTALTIPSWDTVVEGTCAIYEELLSEGLRGSDSALNGVGPDGLADNESAPYVGLQG
jgi:glycosyltransferase involved in cell wall biosynthesis